MAKRQSTGKGKCYKISKKFSTKKNLIKFAHKKKKNVANLFRGDQRNDCVFALKSLQKYCKIA